MRHVPQVNTTLAPKEINDGGIHKKSPDARNPCPFLRALVASGYIDPDGESLSSLPRTVSAAMGSDIAKSPPPFVITLIALLASGKSMPNVLKAVSSGVSVNRLRGGPLDKRGGGSRVIDQQGEICEEQLLRLDTFASDFKDEQGEQERGLDEAALNKMMDDNFARPAEHRRGIDRLLMNGEWPALLETMGKTHLERPYLSLSEVRDLFIDRQLPDRVLTRLPAKSSA